MKKVQLYLLISLFFTACSADDNNRINNPNLPDINFRVQLNLDLPEYNNLQFPGNSYSTYNNGVKGIVIYNINNSQYTAFELSDPNHPPNDCSAMEVDGIIARCNCEDANEYNIVTGELSKGEGQYTLKPYRIERRGNTIEVFN